MAGKHPVEKCMDSYPYKFSKDMLRGKVAFITGGGSGICFTIAEIFMRHGCKMIIAGRTMERLEQSSKTLTEATGMPCVPAQMDVRKPQEVLAAVDKGLQAFGKIDFLINGAAGNFLSSIEHMSYNAFKSVMDIDTLGTFNVSKAVYSKCFKDHGGVIINITALTHYRGSLMQAHVGAAKAGIEYLSKHQAVEWGPKGVRVVCVAPGPIWDTEGMRRLLRKSKEETASTIPIRRGGARSEIGDICLFLVSDMAGLITGSTVVADGGGWLTNQSSYQQLEQFNKKMSKM